MSTDNEKIKLKIKALLAQAESESQEQTDSRTGEKAGYTNIAASLAFAKKAQELAKKYHLDLNELASKQESTIAYVPPVVEQSVIYNPFRRSNARRKERMFWFEELAKVVAKGYFCKAGVNNDGEVFIVGLDFDREVCEMVFLNLATTANKLEPIELKKAKKAVGLPSINKDALILDIWCGDDTFSESFHVGFREQITEIYKDNEQETNSIAVEEYFSKINFWELSSSDGIYKYGINETAKEIGKRAGRVMAKKVGVTKEEAISKQNALIKQQVLAREALGEGGDVILLLDRSVSMGGDRIIEAKEGAIGFATDAINNKKFMVSVIDFGTGSTEAIGFSDNLEQIKEKVNNINVSGSTDMVSAFERARSMFKVKAIRRTICLITDGQPNDYTGTIRVVDNIKRQGIEIMAIGTAGADKEFLDKICSRKGLGLLVSENDFQGGIRRMAGLLN